MTSVTMSGSKDSVRKDTRMGVRIAVGAALSLLTAAMLVLAFPPYNLWPLAFICLVPMLVAEYRLLPMRWNPLAEILGTSLWVLILLTALFGLHAETWFIQGIAGLTVVLNLLTNRATRRFHENTHYRWFVLNGAFDWVGFEMIRSFIPLIRTNLFAAHMVHTQPWLVTPVSVFSIYGLNLLIILVNYAVAQGIFVLLDRRWRWEDIPLVNARRGRRWLIGMGAALMVWAVIGGVMLAVAPIDAPTVRVASTPHDFPNPGHLDAPENQAARLASLTAQTRMAAAEGAQLVVWPELAVGFEPQVEHTDELAALGRETGAYIVAAYGTVTDENSRNAAVMIAPDGAFLPTSGKSHPTPGEHRDPDAGVYPIYETPFGAVGSIICHDGNFTDSSRILARKGARLITASTLEVAIPGMETMYYVQALFRGVENRVSTVVAGNFTAAVIDPYGRILAKRAHRRERSDVPLVADVPLGSGNTVYNRVGDWMGWASFAGYIFFMFAGDALVKWERKREGTPARQANATPEPMA